VRQRIRQERKQVESLFKSFENVTHRAGLHAAKSHRNLHHGSNVSQPDPALN
jgi:hypothetical protein